MLPIINIPPIRDMEEAEDALGLILSRFDQDRLAEIAFRILEGKYGDQTDAFIDQFDPAYRVMDECRAQWAARHDDGDTPSRFDGHPDNPFAGSRNSMWGIAA